MKDILTQSFINAGGHYGYSKSRRHPSVKTFIASTQAGVDFINPEKSIAQLEKAQAFLKEVATSGKHILFVGEKPEVRQLMKEICLPLNVPYMVDRFVAGTITNFGEIRRRSETLASMLSKKEKGEYGVYTKKEQLMIQRTIDRMDRNFGGILHMDKLPGLVVVVDPRHEAIAVSEAQFAHIPVIAIGSTDCDISKIEYPVLANDAAISSIRFILEQFANTLREVEANKKA